MTQTEAARVLSDPKIQSSNSREDFDLTIEALIATEQIRRRPDGFLELV